MNIDSAIASLESGNNLNAVADYLKLLKNVVAAKQPSSTVSIISGLSTAGLSSKKPTSRSQDPDWVKIGEDIKRCKSFEGIFRLTDEFFNGEVENADSIYCRCCPDKSFKKVLVSENGKFTSQFTSKKQTFAKHLLTEHHQKQWRAKNGVDKVEITRNNVEAMTNCAALVLMGIHLEDSFNSYPMRIVLNISAGLNVGFQNHSAAASPKWVDVFYKVLINRLGSQLATPVHFCGEYTSVLTPFSVSADKDTVKH